MKSNRILTGWEVEWCDSIERESDGSMNPDSGTYRIKDFSDKEKAEAFARSVLPKDVFGSVRLTPFHREPYEEGLSATYKEYDRDSEFIEA